MQLYTKTENYTLYNGNMLDLLQVVEPNSIDSIVCDPPYELNFMNKGWDNSGIAFQKDAWEKCFKALKDGGYLLAFGGSRTFHRIACAIEDAGFEIRDCIMWLYGSGFPKSMNIELAIDKKNGVESKVVKTMKQSGAKFKLTQELIDNGGFNDPNRTEFEIKQAQNEWNGWGTALKPAYEPIIVARKPFKGSLVDNILKNGVGGLNIDECRVGNTNADDYDLKQRQVSKAKGSNNDGKFLDELHNKDAKHGVVELGRFPANVIHDGSEEAISGMPEGGKNGSITKEYKMNNQVYGDYGYCKEFDAYEDEGSASRYFYCAKASKKDRDEGLDKFNNAVITDGRQKPIDNAFNRGETERKNIHPTVKPVELMQYLVRLVTPKGGIVLDPFMGSGSTGKAVMFENRERDAHYKFIGIELTNEYLPICESRINFALNKFKYELEESAKKYDTESTQQMTLFNIIDN